MKMDFGTGLEVITTLAFMVDLVFSLIFSRIFLGFSVFNVGFSERVGAVLVTDGLLCSPEVLPFPVDVLPFPVDVLPFPVDVLPFPVDVLPFPVEGLSTLVEVLSSERAATASVGSAFVEEAGFFSSGFADCAACGAEVCWVICVSTA